MGKDNIKTFVNNRFVQITTVIATIIGLIFALLSYFQNNEPKFEYEIVSRTTIFNETKRISSLQVLYDSIDVQQNNLNISVFTIKVINNGQHIAPSFYDDGDFGIKVNNGFVTEKPVVVTTATPHIQNRLDDCFKSYINIVHILKSPISPWIRMNITL